MPKKKNEPLAEKSRKPESGDRETVRKYVAEMDGWLKDLKPYWGQMARNEEMYEFYKSEYTETASNVSLNTPFAIIESQIARENRASIDVTVEAEGDGSLGEFEEWVAALTKGAIEDRRVARIHGTFRKKKERWSRQLKVTGNAIAEAAYCYRTSVRDGEKVTVADNPYVVNRHYTQVVFNPARQLDSSNVYYVVDHMRIEDMEAQRYEEPKEEGDLPSGRFRNLGELRKRPGKKEAWTQTDDDQVRYIAGDTKVSRKNEPVKVVTRWELKPAGWTRCVFADDRVMVMPDQVDPLRIGGHNLLIGMRYVVEGRPYAYGEMDPIYKPVRAQDTIVNQKIEMLNRYLRGSYVAGPSIDVDSLMMVLDQGGVMSGNADEVKPVPVNLPPGQAFQEIGELQQAIERAARYSPYSAGTPNSSSDRTQGTKGGIIALQTAAEPNVETQVDDVEDMFMTPYADMVLRMKAEYMSDDETANALIEGKDKEWVKVARGIVRGKATLRDFVTSGIIGEEQFEDATTTEGPDGRKVKIPGSEDALVFDVSWIVSAKLSVQSATEKQNALSRSQAIIQFAIERLGAQFDADRTTKYLGREAGTEAIDDLLLTKEEKQQKMEAAQQAQQAQQEAEVAKERAIAQAKAPAPQADPVKESVSINYKDAPADIQRQMETGAGFQPSQLHPQVANTLKQALPTPPSPQEQEMASV